MRYKNASGVYCRIEDLHSNVQSSTSSFPSSLIILTTWRKLWLLFQMCVFLSRTPLLDPRELQQLVCAPAVLYFWMMTIDFPPLYRCDLWVSLSSPNLHRLCIVSGRGKGSNSWSTQHLRPEGPINEGALKIW
jgi:hypothetical protein